MEKIGKIGPYGYTARAKPKGDRWVPFLEFAGKVLAFRENLSFKTKEEAFACAMKKAEELARVPPVTGQPGVVRKKRKDDDEDELTS